MRYDTRRVEVVDFETEGVEWTGSTDEFLAANTDGPPSAAELNELHCTGRVVMGGGAGVPMIVRHIALDA